VNDRPLVTFAVFSYNQQAFVREAVQGALAQTYQPLEVVLSDDCSLDATFEIVGNLAAGYSGPHRLVVTRNQENLGVAGHVNRVMGSARGELVVGAAGDDISLPQRTERVVEEWLRSGRDARSLYSSYEEIDGAGRHLGFGRATPRDPFSDSIACAVESGNFRVTGCSHAWHRSVFDEYGPLADEVLCEDVIIPMRSLSLGSIRPIPDVLVRYRRHDGNVWGVDHPRSSVARLRRWQVDNNRLLLTSLRQMRAQLAVGRIRAHWPGEEVARAERRLAERIDLLEALCAMDSAGIRRSASRLLQAWRRPPNRAATVKAVARYLLRPLLLRRQLALARRSASEPVGHVGEGDG
jgi:glycosyltransferase involved in cell wall biosynthesis